MESFLALFILLNAAFVLKADIPGGDVEPRMIPPNYPSRCRRAYPGVGITKASGDNGFFIKISGNPSKYQPNEHYTVTLQGKEKTKKFVGFMLTVEPKEINYDISAQPDVGSFQLLGDVVSKYSENCPNTIVNASKILKSEIKVMWRAPPAETGCIVFRAAIQENRDIWYMDEGRLIRVLCEEEQENQDEQPEIVDECCACDEAKYELTFEGMWTRHTHPKDFPEYEWDTSFTDIIGVSHTNDFRMWEYGKKASEGVKEIAETGDTKRMETEFKAHSNNIRTIIKTRGLNHPNMRSKTFAVFRVDKYHHLMSLLTKMKPSPDWIVGISAMELCLKNCSWIREKVLNLYPWDAGVDNGLTYTSERSMSYPQERIRRITSSTPNNPLSPFYDPQGIPMKPVAQLTITRQRIYDKNCKDYEVPTTANPYSNDGSDERKECRVSDWTDFQPCSVTCGQGFRIRSRRYFNKQKAEMAGCKIQLVDSDVCIQPCVGNVSCRTTEWGEWSECSVTCGKGLRIRSRKFIDSNAKKQCAIDLMQKETCKGLTPVCDDDDDDEPDPQCAVTHWSEWSPCTVTCGKGVTVRMRLYLNPESLKFCNVELSQKSECTADKQDCAISLIEAKKNCMLPKEIGPCRGYFPRWYFDVNRKMCVQFIYGGCRGNRNNFERYADCNRMCENLNTAQQVDLISFPVPSNAPIETTPPPQPVDCVVSEWGEWSPCSQTCDNGRKERRRVVIQNPENGGEPCPNRLIQRRKCKENPPCVETMPNEEEYRGDECVLFPWSEWTPCTRTCGQGEIQMRTKAVKAYPRYNAPSCKPKIERKYCVLPPCPPF